MAGTQNVDRILRLPFTTNLSTTTKRKKGRVACRSTLRHFNETTYPFEMLENALPVGSEGPHNDNTSEKERPRRPDILLDLLLISPRIKDLITGIENLDHPYASRSEEVFAVLIAMLGGGCTDQQIRDVLLNPRLAISAHVREQREPECYVERQIANAREVVTDPVVTELNENYAAVMIGDTITIMRIEDDDIKFLKVSAFEQWHSNRFVQRDKKRVPLGRYWFNHPLRRQHRGVFFSPGRDVPATSIYGVASP